MVKEDIRKYIWIEFVIWLLILFFAITSIKFYNHKIAKKYDIYQIFLPDAYGLIEGSPVRYTGVPIGYIKKIRIVSNEVYLKIVITQKDFKLPKGSVATVEFNGMGGSKSLEIYPPTKDSLLSGKIITVQNPRRLSDATSLLADMFSKIDSIITRTSYFAKEIGVVDFKGGVDTEGIEDNIGSADNLMERIKTVHHHKN